MESDGQPSQSELFKNTYLDSHEVRILMLTDDKKFLCSCEPKSNNEEGVRFHSHYTD